MKEDQILHLLQWPITALRWTGYFPFNIGGGQLSTPKYFLSPSIFITAFFIAGTCLHDITMLTNFSLYMKMALMGRNTDKVVFTAATLLMSFTFNYFRTFYYFRHEDFLKFWNLQCEILRSMRKLNLTQVQLRMLDKVRSNGKIYTAVVMVMLGVSVLATIFFVGLRKLNNYSTGNAEWMTEETIRRFYFVGYMMVMWAYIRTLHALPVIWLSCILKLYTIVFVFIKDELEELKEILSTEDVKNDEEGKIDRVVRRKIEMRLLNCVEMFYNVEKLVIQFTSFFGNSIILDMTAAIFTVLATIYFIIFWYVGSQWSYIVGASIGVLVYSHKIYLLSTEATGLARAGKDIPKRLMALCWYTEEISQEARVKAKLLAFKIVMDPPRIRPGGYFQLDRQLITGILSTMITYLIIMVQFRQADTNEL